MSTGIALLQPEQAAARLRRRVEIGRGKGEPVEAEGVRRVRLLGGDHAAAEPLVRECLPGEGDGTDGAVDVDDAPPHVEVEPAIARSAGGLDGLLQGFGEGVVAGQVAAFGPCRRREADCCRGKRRERENLVLFMTMVSFAVMVMAPRLTICPGAALASPRRD